MNILQKCFVFSFKVGVHFLGRRSNLALIDAFGEPQGVEGLVDVILPRRKVDEHQGFAVAAKTVHQQVSQLRIAVGDVTVLKKVASCK
jgi:hypothetical protein